MDIFDNPKGDGGLMKSKEDQTSALMTPSSNVAIISDNSDDDDGDDDFEIDTLNDHKKPLITGGSNSIPNLNDDDDEEEDSDSGHLDAVSAVGKILIFKPRKKKNRCCLCLCYWFRKFCSPWILMFTLLAILFAVIGFRSSKSFFMIISQPILTERQNHECSILNHSSVWYKSFPMLTIESAIRPLDVNNDSVDDLIVAFGTGK